MDEKKTPTPEEVKALRLSARMTQDAFGRLVDVSGRQVRKWESDEPEAANCPADKWERLQAAISGGLISIAYITGRIFGLLDLAAPLGPAELAQCDIYPAKFFAPVYRTRTLTTTQNAALAELMERLDAFPAGPMGNEEKSHFWLGWHHQRRDMRAE